VVLVGFYVCAAGDVLRWDQQVQLRHMTTGSYLGIDDNQEVCLFRDGSDPATVFRLNPMEKVLLLSSTAFSPSGSP